MLFNQNCKLNPMRKFWYGNKYLHEIYTTPSYYERQKKMNKLSTEQKNLYLIVLLVRTYIYTFVLWNLLIKIPDLLFILPSLLSHSKKIYILDEHFRRLYLLWLIPYETQAQRIIWNVHQAFTAQKSNTKRNIRSTWIQFN